MHTQDYQPIWCLTFVGKKINGEKTYFNFSFDSIAPSSVSVRDMKEPDDQDADEGKSETFKSERKRSSKSEAKRK